MTEATASLPAGAARRGQLVAGRRRADRRPAGCGRRRADRPRPDGVHGRPQPRAGRRRHHARARRGLRRPPRPRPGGVDRQRRPRPRGRTRSRLWRRAGARRPPAPGASKYGHAAPPTRPGDRLAGPHGHAGAMEAIRTDVLDLLTAARRPFRRRGRGAPTPPCTASPTAASRRPTPRSRPLQRLGRPLGRSPRRSWRRTISPRARRPPASCGESAASAPLACRSRRPETRTTRARRGMMAAVPDVLATLTARLTAMFDAVAPGSDPVVRASDRCDLQANGALALAKRSGRAAARGRRAGRRAGRPRRRLRGWSRSPAPGFINLTLSDAYLARRRRRDGRRCAPRRAAGGERRSGPWSTTRRRTWRRRCTSGTCARP